MFEELDEHGQTLSRTHSTMRLRNFHRYETQPLLDLSGFDIEALYGDFERGSFRHGGEQLWVAKPRPEA